MSRRPSVVISLLLVVQVAFPVRTASPADIFKAIGTSIREPVEKTFQRQKPATVKEPTVELLAKEIDWLEHHIETYGTIVPKQPDVWGEARLTKYRRDFETQMSAQLGAFDATLQGALRRSDSSFLALAFALNKAGTIQNVPKAPEGSTPATPAASANTSISDPTKLTKDEPLANIVPRTGVSLTTDEAVKRLVMFAPGDGKLSLEPTVHLDQMRRYLDHLNHLRRINDGDDTSDSPGYAMYLLRVPVSVLPGSRTQKGCGAEITVTAEPVINEYLLANTFRSLVTNDIADQFSLIVTKSLEVDGLGEQLIGERSLERELERVREAEKTKGGAANSIEHGATNSDVAPRTDDARSMDDTSKALDAPLNLTQAMIELRAAEKEGDSKKIENIEERFRATASKTGKEVSEQLAEIASQQSAPRRRRAEFGLSPSQMSDVFGNGAVLSHIIADAHLAIKPPKGEPIMVSDVRSLLVSEISAAYEFLNQERCLWEYCNADLATAIRRRARVISGEKSAAGYPKDAIKYHRDAFFAHIKQHQPRAAYSSTVSFAWAIIVESALLNERLIEDMRQIAAKEGACAAVASPHCWPRLYLPAPNPCLVERCKWQSIEAAPLPGSALSKSVYEGAATRTCQQCEANFAEVIAQQDADYSEAAELFREYVTARWPIIVFALDPSTDDQNIADSLSRRRELQLAASVAVAQGQLGPQAAGRFVRRLEADFDTVALNRTAVAFSHLNDTFGWRFYPRFQTPPTKGNVQAFGETLFGGPTREQDLRQRELEPGIRECTAVVLMPSFVPYVRFDSRANWFHLTNPRNKELTLNDAMKLSRTHRSIHTSLQEVCHSNAYRPGDVNRMMRVVDQLDRRMPLQTMLTSVPIENTRGGFEMFNSGVTDLAPELIGWHGEPGVTTGRPTTLFLVGDNFSVHETQVIAGGRAVASAIISRQIMQVVIPAGINVALDHRRRRVVDIHVATPYGVSGHLEVPVIAEPASPGVFQWSRPVQDAEVRFKIEVAMMKKTAKSTNAAINPPRIEVDTPTLAMPKKATVAMTIRADRSIVDLHSFNVEVLFAPESAQYVTSDGGLVALNNGLKKVVDDHYLKNPDQISSNFQLVVTGTMVFDGATTIDHRPRIEEKMTLRVNLQPE